MNEKLLIIDSYAICFRSFFGMINEPLINEKGDNVSTIAGFFSTLSALICQTNPTHLLVASDSKTKTFRHNIFSQYKANRPKTPEDLHRQIDCVMDILDNFKIKRAHLDGFEADDVIASAIFKFKGKCPIILASGDKDLLQLVDDKNSILQIRPNNSKGWDIYNEKKVEEKYLIPPSKIHLYLSLLGDSSDNIPGVEGIGEKSAADIAKKCSNIDEIYNNDNGFSQSINKKLSKGKDDLILSYNLVELREDIEIPYDFSELEINKTDVKKGINSLVNIGIKSVSKRLEKTLSTYTKNQFEELSLF